MSIHYQMTSTNDRTESELRADRFQLYLYFGGITLFLYLGTPAGALFDIATSFMLKNQLKLGPEAIARFRFVTAIPAYFAFVFGFIRDTWNPFGRRDRGYFILFTPLTSAVFIWLAYGKLTLP